MPPCLFRRLPPIAGGLIGRAICQAISALRGILVSGFLFSMFSALEEQKACFQPFVFNKFSALGIFSRDGHPVTALLQETRLS
jgi:hypothetical protein